MAPRLSVTIIGTFTGALLDSSFKMTRSALLAVSIDTLTLPDGSPFHFTPVYGYFAFSPGDAPLGYLWQVGDRLQVSGQLKFRYEYRGRQQYAAITQLVHRAQAAIALDMRRWLNILPQSASRRFFMRLLNAYEAGTLTLSQLQTAAVQRAPQLSASQREQLIQLQRQQSATMQDLYAATKRLAPEHPLIDGPLQQRTLQLKPGPTRGVRINRNRLASPDYRAELLTAIARQTTAAHPLPMDVPPPVPREAATQVAPKPVVVRTPAPPPVRAQLLATLTAATTLLTVDAAGAVHPLDALAAAVEQVEPPDEPPAAPATRHTRKKAAGQESVLEFNGAWPTALAFDAALIRLQPSLGQRATYTGTLRLVRVVAPNRQAALRRAQDRLAHRLQQAIDRHLAATGAPRLAAYRQLTARLIAGRLSFAAYCRQLAALTSTPDPQLADRQQAAWTAFTARLTTLTAPTWVLADITSNTAPEDGVMMPLLAVDATRLPDAAYRHALFTRWRANAAAAVQQDFNTGS
ncbi:hypothetical protein [Lacticaseibacillus kribbianus]|uniref:hypothetical protein n=1 Tax=Lacticaseibacillus kribbianus TaxID=2926292 RepID=UPI001CD4DE21|nr:hypothetical protein [Lacticaseibacillus kribbianus]